MKKPLADGLITTTTTSHQGPRMLFYRAAVDLSRPTLNYLAGVLRWHRKAIESPGRRLNPGRQACWCWSTREKATPSPDSGPVRGIDEHGLEVRPRGGGAAVGAVAETGGGTGGAEWDGLHLLVLDGTLIACDRVRADRPYYSAKHRCHGMNVQVIVGPDGTIVWTRAHCPAAPTT